MKYLFIFFFSTQAVWAEESILLAQRRAVSPVRNPAASPKESKKKAAAEKKTRTRVRTKAVAPVAPPVDTSLAEDGIEAPTLAPISNASTTLKNSSLMEPPPPIEATWWGGARLSFWQETIKAKRNGEKDTFPSQFFGISTVFTRREKIHQFPRWLLTFGLEGAIGVVNATGTSPDFNDKVLNQPWFSLGVIPGIIYRGTSVTDIYLGIPLTNRWTFWKVKEPLEMDRESSFSEGVSLLAASRLTPTMTFVAGFIHRSQWYATQWQVGFDIHM